MVALCNRIRDGAIFPSEMLQALVVTIPKKYKDTSDLANFSPISLFNADLKICAKALAIRILKYLPNHSTLTRWGLWGEDRPRTTPIDC